MSLAWGDVVLVPPVSSSTGIVDVVFEFPADEERSGTGDSSGPGLGYHASPASRAAFVSADGVDWTTVHGEIDLAVDLIQVASKSADAVLLSSLARSGREDVSDVKVDTAADLNLRIAPNPFNPRVQISFVSSGPTTAEVVVFDLRGRRVARPYFGRVGSGRQTLIWDGSDRSGVEVASGVYLIKIRIGDRTLHRSVSLLR